MFRSALICTAFVVLLAPAASEGAVLYSSMDQERNIPPGAVSSRFANKEKWVAQSFVPQRSGTAATAQLYAQSLCCYRPSDGVFSIRADAGGRPAATSLATALFPAIPFTAGGSPSCSVLGAQPTLTAGKRYWAVFYQDPSDFSDGASWWYWRKDPAAGYAVSTDGGTTWQQKSDGATFSLIVNSAPACAPHVLANPAPGTKIADMYVKPGATAWRKISIANDGTEPLELRIAGFRLNAVFGGTPPPDSPLSLLLDGPDVANPRPFPCDWQAPSECESRIAVAVSTGVTQPSRSLYIRCTGSGSDRIVAMPLVVQTNIYDVPRISWPVECAVDGTPPRISYTVTPSGRSGWFTTTPATVKVQASDATSPVTQIACSDNGKLLPIVSAASATLSVSGEGAHNVDCRATDRAGNQSNVFRTGVKIDSIAPTVGKTGGPLPATRSRSAQFAWIARDTGSGVKEIECRLDGGAWSACTSPTTRSGLAEGTHSFEVRVRDVAGTYIASPARWDWRVDTTPPDTTLSAAPASPTTARTATFTASGSDTGSGIQGLQCSLDGAAWANCQSPISYGNLGLGQHALLVRAVDKAGNVDPTPAKATWTIV